MAVKRRACLTAITFIALALGPTAPRADRDRTVAVDPQVRDWLGTKTVDALVRAGRGQIMRVDPAPLDPPARGKASPANVGGYRILGKVHALDDIQDGGAIKLCGPIQPGVALRFWPAGDTSRKAPVEILFCFMCDDLLVVGPKPWPQSIAPGALKLLRLSISGLPEFEELRAIMRKK